MSNSEDGHMTSSDSRISQLTSNEQISNDKAAFVIRLLEDAIETIRQEVENDVFLSNTPFMTINDIGNAIRAIDEPILPLLK